MQLFYLPEITGNTVTLDEKESKHVVKALRMNEGERVNLIDGKGGIYEARITDLHPKKCRLSIIHVQKNNCRKNFWLHIAIGPTKNIARFEWFLEKATEIGIDEITPIQSEHSERKVVKFDRSEKILISAMKQSQKAFLPKLNELVTFKKFIKGNSDKQKFIAHCNDGEKLHLKDTIRQGKDLVILIGPEGDFSPEEVTLAKENGFVEISLGGERLRTETAGIAACHIANLVNE